MTNVRHLHSAPSKRSNDDLSGLSYEELDQLLTAQWAKFIEECPESEDSDDAFERWEGFGRWEAIQRRLYELL
jgi:hypothetical protein